MFSVGALLKIWNVTDKGSYTEVECSTSKRNSSDGSYVTDFSTKFVRFIGTAHTKRPQPNETVKITECGVQNVYQKNGKNEYLKNPYYNVFDFERRSSAKSTSETGGYVQSGHSNINSPDFSEIPISDDLPF